MPREAARGVCCVFLRVQAEMARAPLGAPASNQINSGAC